jgi:hypothetical protein
MELCECPSQMLADGITADPERARDILVPFAVSDQHCDLKLSPCQHLDRRELAILGLAKEVMELAPKRNSTDGRLITFAPTHPTTRAIALGHGDIVPTRYVEHWEERRLVGDKARRLTQQELLNVQLFGHYGSFASAQSRRVEYRALD